MPEALAAAARRGFDLSREPPLRAHLFALGADEHVLLLLLHHIAGDGWSLAPLLRDLAARLCGALRGRSAGAGGAAGAICGLHAVAARGAGPEDDAGQRDCAPARVLDGSAARAFPSRSSCRPTGRGRRSRAIAAAALPLHIGAELHRRPAGACARQRGRSLFMVLQAALAALLTRLGAGTDIRDRQPDCGAHRQRARRSGRLLRQHAGAAHRHVGQSELPRADRRGCAPAILRPTAIRICRSSGWWRCSTRRARCRGIRCSR